MADEPNNLKFFGLDLKGYDVVPLSANEKFNEYELDDGTKLRVKAVAMKFIRVADQFTPEGDPIYLVSMNPVTSVVSSPLSKKS